MLEKTRHPHTNLKFELKKNGVLVIHPHGPLKSEDFTQLARAIDPWIKMHKKLQGVVLSVSQFPGWENFASFIHHMKFVNSHHKKVRRLALAADGLLPELVSQLASHFVDAEIKQFSFAQTKQAEEWAGGHS